jgi:membrane-bound lytic murein transglycosylase D
MKFCFAILWVLLFAIPAHTEESALPEFPNPALFPLPAGYRENVDFWMRVYGEWGDDKMVIHDARHLSIIFDVMDFPEENQMLRSAARAQMDHRVDQIRGILRDLQKNPSAKDKSDDHRRIYRLYDGIVEPDRFGQAAENLRVQQGIKDRFRGGLIEMTKYIDDIKAVLHEEGVPEEIAYLPLVESSFDNRSLSRTRAAGIWQFMPATARHYMKVNRDVDERLDPYVASRAAARYLKHSYEMFGNWPVAIMSYNHGQQGISRAIQSVGSNDFSVIIRNYDGRVFGLQGDEVSGQVFRFPELRIAAHARFGPAHQAALGLHYPQPLQADEGRSAGL